ncbi:hypothetical protein PLESTF_001148300 [Pleodorina starrii]|nr:hypothetical protein PLESTF_001148300 [Pleodorina starrii]
MASLEYAGPDESEVPLVDSDVYKATSNSDYVVIRRVRLFRSKFITYHNIDENEEDNKQWILSSQCDLVPRVAAEIREPSTKYVRPRGQWAITTLVKPKSIGTRGQPVRLFMFTLSWPTKWAAKGYTSFSFGFEGMEEARGWHKRLAECLQSLRAEKLAAAGASVGGANLASSSGAAAAAPALLHTRMSFGSAATATATGGGGAAAAGGYVRISSGSMPAVVVPTGGRKQAASGDGRAPAAAAEQQQSQPQLASPASGSFSAAEERPRRTSASGAGAAKRSLVYADTGSSSSAAAADGSLEAPAVGAASRGSSFAVASAAAAAAAGLAPPVPPQAAAAPQAQPRPAAPAQPKASLAPKALPLASLPPPPPSSSDSEGPYEELDDSMMGQGSAHPHHHHHHHHHHQFRGSAAGLAAGGGVPCRQSRGTSRGDVHHTKQRWVPYKQVNGVAIYHRPQTAGDAEAGVGGEFMVSTVVRGSPRRCLTALTSHCGNTTILGPALVQEVLQRRQAVDEKEVLRIVVQAPGLTGVICAPRELVVETVFKTDETGPTLVLMFNSCEVPARFVERKPGQQGAQGQQGGQQQQGGQSADEGDTYQSAASSGGRRSWWRRPVCARVRGGYTMAPLEEFSLDNSPEALVTCIIKVDLGGVCGERSWLRLASDLVGWTDAFLDRMLMAVTLLRDEVEQGRFVVQPLSMMATSSRVKDRDRDGSMVDLTGLAAASRSAENVLGAAAASATGVSGLGGGGGGGGGASGGGGAGGRRSGMRQGSSTAKGVGRVRSRTTETDRASLVDTAAAADGPAHLPTHISAVAAAASGGVAGGATAAAAGGAAPSAAAAEGAGTLTGAGEGEGVEGEGAEAEEYEEAEDVVSEAGPGGPGPALHSYDTMEEILARMRGLSLLDTSVWDNLHQPGKDAPFKIRGPTYLKDRKKIPAGYTRFVLGSMDVIQQPPGVMHEHVARFIPAIRQSGAPFSVVIHLVIPGTPLLGIVATFVTDRHPSQLGRPPAQPMEDEHDWEPFDFVLHKYMTGSTHVRNHMLKLIPHIADGSWMIKQSVGTTPVILGKQLRTIYYETPQYIEIDIDISANNVASYVTGLVRGATRSLVIDMGFVLEGTTPWELPEALLGTLRLYNLDIRNAKLIDVSREIPLRPPNMAPPPTPTPTPPPQPQSSQPRSLQSQQSLKYTGGPSSNAATPGGAAASEAPSSPPGGGGGGSAVPSGPLLGRVSAAVAATPTQAAAAAAGASVSGAGRLTSVGGSAGGAGGGGGGTSLPQRGGGLSGMESAPAASPALESPNGGASAGSRPSSAAQTPMGATTPMAAAAAASPPRPPPSRGLAPVSNIGAVGVGGGSPAE